MLLLLSMVIQPSKVTDRITPDSVREMANPLRPTGNCFSIGLIDGTLRLHAQGPSLILPGLESCSLLNESIRSHGAQIRNRTGMVRIWIAPPFNGTSSANGSLPALPANPASP